MSTVAESSPNEDELSPQSFVETRLALASDALRDNDPARHLIELEAAYSRAQATPYDIRFQTRLQVILELAEAYLRTGEVLRARSLLGREAAFAERIVEIIQQTGTDFQKRQAAGVRVQLRDRARQVALLGEQSPEISLKLWLKGEPATLAALRGRVVLLEFWATWCKPCREMFPKLKRLDELYRERGLEVISITRHYLARRGDLEAERDELRLMRRMIEDEDLNFRVGVAEDERLQTAYGATGLPMLALIDRKGLVRYAHFGGGQEDGFEKLLNECLDKQV